MAVYDRPRVGDFDETAADVPPGDPYADSKLQGERAVLAAGARHGVPVAVIQPAVVYGPNAGVYGSEIIEEFKTHRVPLVSGGNGICNAVYVDDVVSALILAATSQGAAGERFLVSGPEHPTWAEFFGHFERMLGVRRTIPLTEAEMQELWRRTQRRPWLLEEIWRVMRRDKQFRRRLFATKEGGLARSALDRAPSLLAKVRAESRRAEAVEPAAELPLAAMRPWVIENLARKAQVRIDKARRVLGYEPAFDLRRGMELTEQWARWAGLI